MAEQAVIHDGLNLDNDYEGESSSDLGASEFQFKNDSMDLENSKSFSGSRFWRSKDLTQESGDEELDINISTMLGGIPNNQPVTASHPMFTSPKLIDAETGNLSRESIVTKKINAGTSVMVGKPRPKNNKYSGGFEKASLISSKNDKSVSARTILTEEAQLIEIFKSTFDTVSPDTPHPASNGRELEELADVLNTFERETHCRKLEKEDDSNTTFEDMKLIDDDGFDNDDWERIEADELNEDTQEMTPVPSVVYKPGSFTVAVQEYVNRYQLPEEQKKTLTSAWTVLKWAGEFGYAVVSEPIVDAAHWIVRRQFGCDIDELPEELRMRLMASLSENMREVLRYSSRTLLRGGGFVLPARNTEHNSGDT